ncbi:MAG: CoA-transferase [Dehalococcoidales bacterium]|nr:CoA-transferase [Dehalococcoidales bacterium]
MPDNTRKEIEDTLASDNGENKVLDLKDAVARYVKPGMQLHMGDACNGILREIIRQYRGQKPGFTLVGTSARDAAVDLVHCGLAKKLIVGAAAESYPQQGLSRIMQRASKEQKLEIESWTLLTIFERLMAGAMGISFLPTKSVLGTSMAQANKEAFREIADPFGGSQTLGAVKAINPDLSLVHAWAADPHGNVVFAPEVWSGGQTMWGAFASKGGALVTVEKLLSTEQLRQYQSMVKIPGYIVKSVSVVPFGAHPQPLGNPAVPGLPSYSADYDFFTEHRVASRKPETLNEWLDKWVFSCPAPEDYLRKLGYDRILSLRGKAQAGNAQARLEACSDKLETDSPANSTELMVLAAAAKMTEAVQKNNLKIILTAIGTAALASYISFYNLKRSGYPIEIAGGTGIYGFTPPMGDPHLWYDIGSLLPACKMLTDSFISYGVFVAGNPRSCVSIMGAGQIDKYGNGNSTRAPDGSYLVGSGGAGDAAMAPVVFLLARQSTDRFVDKVSYITFPGSNVKALISDKGIFEKPEGSDELVLTGYFRREKLSRDEIVVDIKQTCGWELKVASRLSEAPAPNKQDLLLMRMMDPAGFFRGE